MCFKTAGLPAPSKNEPVLFTTDNYSATVSILAVGTRDVELSIPGGSQWLQAADLRELAAHFNELADKLEA